ncbi:MAG: hypothetical protein AB7F86_04300 [Bdellovibrionales bacterium]
MPNSIGYLIVSILLSSLPAQAALSIMQGPTSETTTELTVLARREQVLKFEVQGRRSIAHMQTYPGSPWVLHRIRLEDLDPDQVYELSVLDLEGNQVDHRRFGTLNSKKKSHRVAVGSCMIRQLHNPFLWSQLAQPQNRPDMLLLLGDTTYLDRSLLLRERRPTTGLEVWEQFVKMRQRLGYFSWSELVPVQAVWDDHDSGGNNVDGHFALMPEIRRIFEMFFPRDDGDRKSQGPGLARRFEFFGRNFVMLDGRSFRDLEADSPAFGGEQEKFLFKSLRPGLNFISNGIQFFGGPLEKNSVEHNWSRYLPLFMSKLKQAADAVGATIVFLSGDVHFSEVLDIEPDWLGYRTVEITSSNIHSFGFPGHYLLKPRNPRRRVVTGTHNIVLLEFSSQSSGFDFVTRSLGWRGNDLFRTVVSISGRQTCELALVNGP